MGRKNKQKIQAKQEIWEEEPEPFPELCRFCYRKVDYIDKHHKICAEKTQPPGTRIYTDLLFQIYEVDPDEHREYVDGILDLCKLELNVYFKHEDLDDIHMHMYYILVKKEKKGIKTPLGFFTKRKDEKVHMVNKIWVFQEYRKRGYGQFMMEVAAHMATKQRLIGQPETLHTKGFKQFYANFIKSLFAKYVHNQEELEPNLSKFLIKTAEETGLHPVHLSELLYPANLLKESSNVHFTVGEELKYKIGDIYYDESMFKKLWAFDKTKFCWTPDPLIVSERFIISDKWNYLENYDVPTRKELLPLEEGFISGDIEEYRQTFDLTDWDALKEFTKTRPCEIYQLTEEQEEAGMKPPRTQCACRMFLEF